MRKLCFQHAWHVVTHSPVARIVRHDIINPLRQHVLNPVLHGVEHLPANIKAAKNYVVGEVDYVVETTEQGWDKLQGDIVSLNHDFRQLGRDIDDGAQFLKHLAVAWADAIVHAWEDIKCDLIKAAMDIAVAVKVASNAVPGAVATDVEWEAFWIGVEAASKSLGKQGVNTLLGPLISVGIASAGANKTEQSCGTGMGEAALIQMETPAGSGANTRGFLILIGKQVMLAENQCGSWLSSCFHSHHH